MPRTPRTKSPFWCNLHQLRQTASALALGTAILGLSVGLAESYSLAHEGEAASAAHSLLEAPEPLSDAPVYVIGARMLDLDGQVRRLGEEEGLKPVALVFLSDTCPISNRYAPELNDFHAMAQEAGVAFYGVMSSLYMTRAEAEAFRDERGLSFPILLDPSGDLALRLRPSVTPEAFVITTDDRLAYRGRIDNRFASIGELRSQITSHDLHDAMLAVSSTGGVMPDPSVAIGCFFDSWEEGTEGPVSYTRDIAPILAANCVECHKAGGIAPFPLESYRQARRRADMLAYVTAERIMPPWPADPSHGRFRDERILSQRQIDLITAWATAGAPQGDLQEQPPQPQVESKGWRLGEPDLLVSMPEPFEVPATGDDIYRYFVIPSELLEDKVVVAVDFQPGDPSVVHHANFFIDYLGRGREKDEEDPAPGFSVFGTGGFMEYDGSEEGGFGIGGWAPGSDPHVLPPGLGMYLPRGGDFIMEVHYHLTGKATRDRSQIALYFADKPVDDYIDGLVIGTQDLEIPAGESSYWRHIHMDVPAGFTLVDVSPHMHYIGTEVVATATLPDGTKLPLIRIADWDFRWQNVYAFREPVYLPAGSRIDVWFAFDNSDGNPANPNYPAKPVIWGWQTTDEMAEVWMTIVHDDWADRDALLNASWGPWLRPAGSSEPPSPLLEQSSSLLSK